MSLRLTVFDIQRYSLYDGPGIRTVIFLKGCPLHCAWCHNPESQAKTPELAFYSDKCSLCRACERVCPNNVHSFENSKHTINRNACIACGKCADYCNFSALRLIGKEYTIDEIMEEISKDEIFFAESGGVTFSGGEPFMQSEALLELLKRCKQKKYSVCIETSGFTNMDDIKKCAPYVDCFLYDCKETDVNNHKKYIGVDNALILGNLKLLNSLETTVILRCPIIPNVNDRLEHFEKIAQIAERYSCIHSVELMPYHPLGIPKAEQIGKECRFSHQALLQKSQAKRYANIIQKLTAKPVKVSG